MRRMFSKDGLRWGMNRMPIGSSDFANSYYSLDDTVGDLGIEHLNLTRDDGNLLLYIKAAMAVNPDLKVWGSPWTGPEWMKDSAPQMPRNAGCGSLSSDPKAQAAYALYLAKAAKAYIAAGLHFEHLAIQNEPNQGATWNGHSCGDSYPKMHWGGELLHSFLKDHLGPTFQAQNLTDTVGILLATFPVNEFEGYVQPTLADPGALKYLAGVGLQYAGVGMIAQIKAAKPSLKTWETETPCGGGRARDCGNGPGTRNNSWAWGEGQWRYMRSFIESGASVYSQWNMVLDETGKSGWGWAQCSPITVHRDTKTVTYEGSFWATKHFSYFVDVDAVVLSTSGDNGNCISVNGACGCFKNGVRTCDDQAGGGEGKVVADGVATVQVISFKNPSGEVIIVGLNARDTASTVNIHVDAALAIAVQLPPHSMNTFTVQ